MGGPSFCGWQCSVSIAHAAADVKPPGNLRRTLRAAGDFDIMKTVERHRKGRDLPSQPENNIKINRAKRGEEEFT